MLYWVRLAAACAIALSGAAFAQPTAVPDGAAPDLRFPSQPVPITELTSPRMALVRPDGSGPFAALVLHHQCGGLGRGQWVNLAMLEWTRRAARRGYAVLLLDSFGPRGVDWLCMGPKGGVNFARGVRDALQAAEHLRGLPFVDKARIAHVGFSWGAMVGLLANSRSFRNFQGGLPNFTAYVSFYPGCFTIKRPDGGLLELVRGDMDQPHMVLLGGLDTETPASECVDRLGAAKAAGAPVEWHVFQSATHCWDCENLNGLVKVDVRGNRVAYHYDAGVTADSEHRLFEFLIKALAARP